MAELRVLEAERPKWLPSEDLARSERAWRVGDNLPAGYDAYLRLFHPFTPWGAEEPEEAGPGDWQTWRALAEKAGVDFRPTLQWNSLKPALPLLENGTRPYSVLDGELEPRTRQRLFGHLRRHTPPQSTFYLYDLAASVGGQVSFMIEAAVGDMERIARWVDERGAAVASTPELVWPEDRRWIVFSDYDTPSTYIGADAALAADLFADPELETLAVDLATRIDWQADEDG